MTMAAAGTNAQIAPTGGLRIALIAISVFATLGAIADSPILFLEFHKTAPLVLAKVMISPLIAGAAFIFAMTSRLRAAIAALAALILVAVVADLPSFPIHDFKPGAGMPELSVVITRVVLPLLGITALMLAIRDTCLGPVTFPLALAVVIAALPKIAMFMMFLLFTIGIMLAGRAAP